MEENKFKKGANFFGELARRFQREQIEFSLPENNCLPILMNGQEVGAVIPDGAMRIPKAFVDDTEVSDLCQRTGEIAAEVREYMKLLEDAPSLKASSLSEPYKLLADFNGYVLGGTESNRGVQFTTWQWTYDHDSLTLGHYFGSDYAAAKQDFALRSGLVPEEKRFTPEQLIEIYRCCADTMASGIPLTFEQEKRIDEIQTQITGMVPNCADRFKQAQEQDAPSQQTM
ncbi:MAG: hypothetical protein QMB62_09280 [Oscillospiraceae bacterium]|jgi:hypothetical protein